MELAWLAGLLAAVAAWAAALLGIYRRRPRRVVPWDTLGRTTGLAVARGGGRLEGTLDGLAVTVRELEDEAAKLPGRRGTVLQIAVYGFERIPDSLELSAEGLGSRIGKVVFGSDLTTGDDAFDEQVVVKGHPVVTMGQLDDITRSRVSELVSTGGRVERSVLAWRVVADPPDPECLAEKVRAALALARRLFAPADPAPALGRNARSDPLGGVRLTNLQVLQNRFPHRPDTMETCRYLLSDRDARVRLAAARPLAEEGRPTLLALATGDSLEEVVAVAALDALGPHVPIDQALSLLARSRASGRRVLAQAAVAAMGRAGGSEAVEPLLDLLRGSDPEVAAAAARALGAAGEAAAAPALERALSSGSQEVAVAAATALARVGTGSTVPVLRAALERRDVPGPQRRALVRAMAAIRQRAGSAVAGRLALVQGEGGEVTLAASETGRLVLTTAARPDQAPDDPTHPRHRLTDPDGPAERPAHSTRPEPSPGMSSRRPTRPVEPSS